MKLPNLIPPVYTYEAVTHILNLHQIKIHQTLNLSKLKHTALSSYSKCKSTEVIFLYCSLEYMSFRTERYTCHNEINFVLSIFKMIRH